MQRMLMRLLILIFVFCLGCSSISPQDEFEHLGSVWRHGGELRAPKGQELKISPDNQKRILDYVSGAYEFGLRKFGLGIYRNGNKFYIIDWAYVDTSKIQWSILKDHIPDELRKHVHVIDAE